jgi:hypothetical protein
MKHFLCAAVAALGLSSATPSDASVLLDLVNPPVTAGTVYDLIFIANSTETTLWVGGYQNGTEAVDFNSVTTGGGPNLLGSLWTCQHLWKLFDAVQ